MSDYQDVDFFGDSDLAEPKNLPTGERFIGKITDADTSQTEAGNFKKFQKADEHGRTEVPCISLVVRALGYANGLPLDPDENYMRVSKMGFNIGREDRISRNMLANLIKGLTGITDEQLRSMSIKDAARRTIGGYVTFEVTHTAGTDRTFQNFRKVKPASAEEEAIAVAF